MTVMQAIRQGATTRDEIRALTGKCRNGLILRRLISAGKVYVVRSGARVYYYPVTR